MSRPNTLFANLDELARLSEGGNDTLIVSKLSSDIKLTLAKILGSNRTSRVVRFRQYTVRIINGDHSGELVTVLKDSPTINPNEIY